MTPAPQTTSGASEDPGGGVARSPATARSPSPTARSAEITLELGRIPARTFRAATAAAEAGSGSAAGGLAVSAAPSPENPAGPGGSGAAGPVADGGGGGAAAAL